MWNFTINDYAEDRVTQKKIIGMEVINCWKFNLNDKYMKENHKVYQK